MTIIYLFIVQQYLCCGFFVLQIRATGLAIAASMFWIVLFLLGSAYPIAQESLGLSICMFGFGVITMVSSAFGYRFIPETRGKSFEEITQMLTNS